MTGLVADHGSSDSESVYLAATHWGATVALGSALYDWDSPAAPPAVWGSCGPSETLNFTVNIWGPVVLAGFMDVVAGLGTADTGCRLCCSAAGESASLSSFASRLRRVFGLLYCCPHSSPFSSLLLKGGRVLRFCRVDPPDPATVHEELGTANQRQTQ